MKVIYDEELSQIVLAAEDGIVTILHTDICSIDTPIFNVDKRVPLDIATRIFQRWHQIDQSAEPEFIARALNDALNSELTVWINDCSTPVYHGSRFDSEMIREFICDNSELVSDEFHFNLLSVKHNVTEDRVEYFIDDKLKGWLPIVRKEIAT